LIVAFIAVVHLFPYHPDTRMLLRVLHFFCFVLGLGQERQTSTPNNNPNRMQIDRGTLMVVVVVVVVVLDEECLLSSG